MSTTLLSIETCYAEGSEFWEKSLKSPPHYFKPQPLTPSHQAHMHAMQTCHDLRRHLDEKNKILIYIQDNNLLKYQKWGSSTQIASENVEEINNGILEAWNLLKKRHTVTGAIANFWKDDGLVEKVWNLNIRAKSLHIELLEGLGDNEGSVPREVVAKNGK